METPHTGIAGSTGNYESMRAPLKGGLYQYSDLSKLAFHSSS